MRAGRLAEAEKLALASLRDSRGVEKSYGSRLSIDALRRIVELYTAQARLSDAEPFTRELVDRLTHTLGTKHPMTLEPMHSLATMMAMDGRFRQAANMLKVIHDACTEIYGMGHPATQKAASRLKQALQADAESFGDKLWLESFFEGPTPPVALEPMH